MSEIEKNTYAEMLAEIDEVIETHGGWPGAFSTATDSEVRT
jgi:hypothetical protein